MVVAFGLICGGYVPFWEEQGFKNCEVCIHID
jgi:hypothetical protein